MDKYEYFCPNCDAILNDQPGFDPSEGYWKCTECGQMLTGDDIYDGEYFEDIVWFCDNCGALLNKQSGFSDTYGSWLCTECYHRNSITEDDIFDSDEDYERHKKIERWSNLFDSITSSIINASTKYQDEDDDSIECPNCGAILNNQSNYSRYEYDLECEECGAVLHRDYYTDPFEEVENNEYDDEDDDFDEDDDYDDNYDFSLDKREKTQSNDGIKISKGTVKIVLIFTAILVAAMVIISGIWEYRKLIPMQYNSNDFIGANYEDVYNALNEAGFTNINLEANADLKIDEDSKENMVFQIYIFGKNSFEENDKYPYDTPILVKYHTIKPISPPFDSKEVKKMMYQDVVKEFEKKGFVNIRTEVKYDIITEWFTKDGEIEKVTIDGKSKFSTYDEYRPDVEVIIVYHTFRKNKNE